MKRGALDEIKKKNPRLAKRLAFAFDYPDTVINEPLPPPKPPVEQFYKNYLRPGYLQKGYGGSKEWPFDFARAVEQQGYRMGIKRAILNKKDYNWDWRKKAALWMVEVDDVVDELEHSKRGFIAYDWEGHYFGKGDSFE